MNRDLYSNSEFKAIKDRLNKQILRRGTYKWWDPLTTPTVGEDKTSPLNLPLEDNRVPVDDKTYTINTSSEGSIERTRNIDYPSHGDNPGGSGDPVTSASHFNVDEMKNFLVGLAKIKDINLFYGRDEIPYLAFRDPQGIEDVLVEAENSKLNKPLLQSDVQNIKNDPNGGIQDHANPNWPAKHEVSYPVVNGVAVMPSGEYDGEEVSKYEGLGVNNFYDDYGAEPGDSSFHPFNRYTSEMVRRDWNYQGNDRTDQPIRFVEGGIKSTRFGYNPRNPQQGNPYRSRPAYGGVLGACNVACTGMCFKTCDNECSESCHSTCWSRCGNACTSSCGNVCTGCSTMCYTSCKTKCENATGYSCMKAGAKTVIISTTGGSNGQYAKNSLTYTLYSCQGCSYSCQFYPNKKTECWDSACMGKCFISCNTACSTSCYGGCIDNDAENGSTFKTGKGRGCSGGCTLNCIGLCNGTCEGYCIQTCWHACKQTCSDNCSWNCSTDCGSGCFQKCSGHCTGCMSCTGSCEGQAYNRGCIGCGTQGGCTSSCQHDCNKNCIGWGCRSICGIDAAGACEANCRINCMSSSCTSMCEDACSGRCTTCVNTCGFQCGPCTSQCSAGCGAACNITCTENCQHNCDLNCVHSCSEACGGCSDLCYSCIGRCIGVCSVKCEDGCSSCANTCGWWCDSSCSQGCFSNCSDRCISTCVGSCATFLESSPSFVTNGPERPPTSNGYIYPNPATRWQERESFKIMRDIPGYPLPEEPKEPPRITITLDEDKNLIVLKPEEIIYVTKQTSVHGGVYNVDQTTGEISINTDMIPGIVDINKPNVDGGGGIFIVILYYNHSCPINDDDIVVKLPFGFEAMAPIIDKDNNKVIIIRREEFLIPEEI